MEFKEAKVFNFEGAFRGMRNPMNSWDKSDSYFGLMDFNYPPDAHEEVIDNWVKQELKNKNIEAIPYDNTWEELWSLYFDWIYKNEIIQADTDMVEVAAIGPKDFALAQKLILSGAEHAKFMRQIFVSVDITAPIFWWKEMDTYKIGTTANSTSTMHKLTSKPITIDSFEIDDYNESLIIDNGETDSDGWTPHWHLEMFVERVVESLEDLRKAYLETNDKVYWKELIRWLPESYLQTRTWTANYAVLRSIYFQRKNHKLTEWRRFCHWIKSLPYGGEFITIGDKNETN